jgi:hypothetical protein
MKPRLLFSLLALILALSPAVTRAEGDKPKHDDTELGKSMDTLSKAWRKLRRQAADPAQNADSLALLVTIQAAANENLKYTPDLARDIPAEKRDKFVAGYRAKMQEMIKAFAEVETAFKAGDNKKAVDLITQIAALQKEGHKEYKRPD